MCVRSLSLLRGCLVTGSTPLLSSTFVLEVRNQWGAPIQGEAGGKGKEGGRRRTGQRGWELNNG